MVYYIFYMLLLRRFEKQHASLPLQSGLKGQFTRFQKYLDYFYCVDPIGGLIGWLNCENCGVS
jgi:hypothetical protein